MEYFLLSAFLTVFLLLTESAGEKKAEKVIGILGESVVFHLKTSEEFKQILWLRTSTKIFAILNKEQSCKFSFMHQALEGRLNVSEDCMSLQIRDLRQDDSDTYTAQIPIGSLPQEDTFHLHVYKNLSQSDLDVRCKKITLSDGNQTFQLNCSAREWDNSVNYSWASDSNGRNKSLLVVLHDPEDNDLNVTCTAQNPVGNASKTVSLKQACEAALPTTEPGTVDTTETGNKNEESRASKNVIPVAIVITIAIIVAACMGYCLWKKKKRATHCVPPDSPRCTVPDESSKTIYAQIDCLPSEIQQTGTKKTQQRKGPKTKDGPRTIYANVVQPRPVILRTDDEKIQMEGRGAKEKSEKTVDSNIASPQETDDPGIKTIYDTVHAPRCPEESDFHKLL